MIAGFILGNNSGDDRIVVRGMGPSLTALGVPNALANPTLELRDSNGALLISNNDWQDDPAQAAELTAAGLAPTNALESGIAVTLAPGLYTALLAGRATALASASWKFTTAGRRSADSPIRETFQRHPNHPCSGRGNSRGLTARPFAVLLQV